jgi:hypothetical protein
VIATPPQIMVRVEDDISQGGYAYCSAFLIHPNIAILQFGDSIELYKVKQVTGDAVYEPEAMMAPFECPQNTLLNFDELVKDATALTFGDFCYRYSEVFG